MPDLRRFGYLLDREDRWVHPIFGLKCEDPEALLACDPEQLEDFHADRVWADGVQARARPAMAPEISTLVRDYELEWDGWLEAFETGNGDVYVTLEELEDMGPEGFREVMNGATAWYDRHAMRTVGGCAGLGVMVLWLALGWLTGVVWWLLGMAAIAVVTWMIRPRPRPKTLWGPIDPARFESALEEATERVDEEWEDVLLRCGALPAGDDHIRLVVIRRTIRTDVLVSTFDPDTLAAILHTLAPVEDDE
ncbi:MAG TPA: hypothetical protein QGF58_14000 [Myxococcota bacterium]|nr:hypothetical protein [Myxococcota bacterium]